MGHTLVYGLGVAISPIPIATVLAILSSRDARANGLLFACGWVAGVAGCAVVFTLLVKALDLTDSHPVWIAVAELALGIAFLAVGVRLWGRRRRPPSHPWLEVVDRLTAARSAALGIAVSAANPKVLALSLGAALALAQTGANAAVTVSTNAVFVAIGAAGVVIPTTIYLAFPARSAAGLARIRRWLARHELAVLIGLAVAIGALFIQDGLSSVR